MKKKMKLVSLYARRYGAPGTVELLISEFHEEALGCVALSANLDRKFRRIGLGRGNTAVVVSSMVTPEKRYRDQTSCVP